MENSSNYAVKEAKSTASGQNPTIDKQGNVTILSPNYCTWKTANGSGSTLTIVNTSSANTLTIAIQGAPMGLLVSLNGVAQTSLNGFFTLPPNTPTFSLQAVGDFLGQTVTITNSTNQSKNAGANIVCQTS